MIQRLFAPFLPFATEESWSWWQGASVHRAQWPDASLFASLAGTDAITDTTIVVFNVLREIRRAKSEAKVSMKAVVDHVIISDSAVRLATLRSAERDLCDAGQVKRFETAFAESFGVGVTLA